LLPGFLLAAPCLEFAAAEDAYVSDKSCLRLRGNAVPLYYDNRYWAMWKLPMFGCSDGQQVLREIAACRKAFPNAYIRMVGFDSVRQVQIAGLLVHRPANVKDFQSPSTRSV
jgi:ribulose-bisphosphate carboxylase small chain